MLNNSIIEALKASPKVQKLSTAYINSLYQNMFGGLGGEIIPLDDSEASLLFSSDLLGLMSFLDSYKVKIGIMPSEDEGDEFIGILENESYPFPSRRKACEEMCKLGILKLEEILKESE